MIERVAVDSSALVAILNGEAEARDLESIVLDCAVTIGWPTVLEVRLWLRRRPAALMTWLEERLDDESTTVLPFGRSQELIAREAARRYGRGHHPAALNFGDCIAYAVAEHEGLPLLFKGADFGKTDVRVHPGSVLL